MTHEKTSLFTVFQAQLRDIAEDHYFQTGKPVSLRCTITADAMYNLVSEAHLEGWGAEKEIQARFIQADFFTCVIEPKWVPGLTAQGWAFTIESPISE